MVNNKQDGLIVSCPNCAGFCGLVFKASGGRVVINCVACKGFGIVRLVLK